MKVDFLTNAEGYREKIIAWMAAFGAGVRDTVRYQGRLLGEKVISLTPPRNRAQGRKAVAADIRRVILGLEDLPPSTQVQLVEKGETVVRAFIAKDGTVYGVDRAMYRPEATQDEISRYHQSLRGARGRVSRAGSQTRDIGRWKFMEKLVVTKESLDEYIRTVQARVGRGKGGWAGGTLALGGNVAGWVAEHARTAGTFVDGTNERNPFIFWENKSEWASGGDEDRVMQNAMQSRIQQITKSILNPEKIKNQPIFK